MKTKLSLILLILALSPMPCALSQIPQGFNYQAIARDGSGNILPNTSLQAMLYVQSLSTGGTVFWKELHSTVTTNSFGLFTLVVGKGTRQTESTMATFDLIEWSVTPKYLKTEIYYSGSWKDMGTSQLLAVPYAMVAEDLAGSVKKLAVAGETSGLEEALFEVKNKDGQTVFAVYNEGVRVYVSDGAKALKGGFAVGGFGTDKAESTKYLFVGKDSVRIYLDTNPLTKSIKSGFAVGGYDLTKGTVQNYLDISSDSVRIYIDSNPDTKKLKGGFAVGGYDMTKGITGDYFNVSGKSDAEVIIGEPRVLWYPAKEAFRSGNVLIESKDSVGLNSWASGYRSKAIGNYSQALGYQAIARKDYSTAIGYQAVANKINSFAFGQWATAKNEESYAFGRGAIAEGFRSYAFGSAGVDSAHQVTGVTLARGDYSFAIGQGSQSLKIGAFSMGLADTAGGDYSVAIGYKSSASKNGCTAIGYTVRATGIAATALGIGTTASGVASTAMGISTKAEGMYSFAMGAGTKATEIYSTAMGSVSTASGQYSTAIGSVTTASGNGSLALGNNTKARSAYETVIGRLNVDYTPISTTAWIPSDRLFVIGNGDAVFPSNALTVLKNGNVGIGTSNPVNYLHIATKASGGGITIDEPDGTKWANIRFREGGGDNYGGFIEYNANNDVFVMGTIENSTVNVGVSVVRTSGNVGIGTITPGTKLAIAGLTGTTSGSYLRIYNDNVYYYSSSIKTKTDIEPLEEDFYKILQAQPVSFTDKVSGERNIGFIAEEFDKIGLSNLVIYEKGEPVSLSYELISLYNLEIIKNQQKAIKEQQQQIEIQNQKIDQLIVLIDELKKEIASLRSQ
ncbi:MAG: tail fiber domain-containing protein [Bacteroidia bacterium]|nr:tail fiber domain-containing protein [Bacteroidia bacterium]